MSWAGCSKVNLTFKPELFWRNRKDKEESFSESTVILYYQIRRTLIVHDTGKPGLGNQWYQYKEFWIIIVISSMPLSNKHVFLLIHKIFPLKATCRGVLLKAGPRPTARDGPVARDPVLTFFHSFLSVRVWAYNVDDGEFEFVYHLIIWIVWQCTSSLSVAVNRRINREWQRFSLNNKQRK